MTSRRINIVEVGPRDGLQSEPEILSTRSKAKFINRAIEAGVRRLEVKISPLASMRCVIYLPKYRRAQAPDAALLLTPMHCSSGDFGVLRGVIRGFSKEARTRGFPYPP